MKKICLLLVYVCFVCWGTNAQTSDEYKVSINALVADENIPEEATRNLENKLRRALTINGIADNGYAERFVLTAKVDIISKDIAPGASEAVSISSFKSHDIISPPNPENKAEKAARPNTSLFR